MTKLRYQSIKSSNFPCNIFRQWRRSIYKISYNWGIPLAASAFTASLSLEGTRYWPLQIQIRWCWNMSSSTDVLIIMLWNNLRAELMMLHWETFNSNFNGNTKGPMEYIIGYCVTLRVLLGFHLDLIQLSYVDVIIYGYSLIRCYEQPIDVLFTLEALVCHRWGYLLIVSTYIT